MYIIIAGCGLVGRGLAKQLIAHHHDVVVIDKDKNVCEEVYSDLGAMAISGSATSINIMEEAGIRKCEVTVALMRNDADNLAFSLLANNFKVPQIVVRMRNPKYEEAYRLAGVTTIVRMIDLFLNQLLMEIEKPKARRVITIGGGKAELIIVRIPKEGKVAGKTVSEIAQNRRFPKECILAGIYNEEKQEFIFPRGNKKVSESDQVFLVARAEDIKKATDFLIQEGK